MEWDLCVIQVGMSIGWDLILVQVGILEDDSDTKTCAPDTRSDGRCGSIG